MATSPRDAYDRWAVQYDADANDTRELNARVLRKQIFIGADDTVLELGCGSGLKNTQWLAAQVGTWWLRTCPTRCSSVRGSASIPSW